MDKLHTHGKVSARFAGYRCHKSSISSRLCIILDPNFPGLVLEVLRKLWQLEKKLFFRCDRGSSYDPKKHQKSKSLMKSGGVLAYNFRPLIE